MHEINMSQTLPQQLKGIREDAGASIVSLAEKTKLSRLTVSAAEGKSDPRLSTLAALFDALGYALIPVPKPLLSETVNFINNGGVTVSLPPGVSAPLSPAMAYFDAAKARIAEGGL